MHNVRNPKQSRLPSLHAILEAPPSLRELPYLFRLHNNACYPRNIGVSGSRGTNGRSNPIVLSWILRVAKGFGDLPALCRKKRVRRDLFLLTVSHHDLNSFPEKDKVAQPIQVVYDGRPDSCIGCRPTVRTALTGRVADTTLCFGWRLHAVFRTSLADRK